MKQFHKIHGVHTCIHAKHLRYTCKRNNTARAYHKNHNAPSTINYQLGMDSSACAPTLAASYGFCHLVYLGVYHGAKKYIHIYIYIHTNDKQTELHKYINNEIFIRYAGF